MKNYTYQNCKTLITNNRYDHNDMMYKLDLFLMMDRLTYDEYIELTGLMEPAEVPPEVIPEEPPIEKSGDSTDAKDQ